MNNSSESFPPKKEKKTDWSRVEEIIKKRTEGAEKPDLENLDSETMAKIIAETTASANEKARERIEEHIQKIKEKGRELAAKARAGTLTEEEREAFKKFIKSYPS